MADQGFRFNNFLNNQPAVDWRNAPNVFKGGAFQSLLQPAAAAAPDNWNSTPQRRLEEITRLKKLGYSDQDIQNSMAASAPPATSESQGMGQLYSTLADTMKQNAFWQTPEGMRMQLEMGKELAKEQASETLKYKTLANLPGQIERAFAADKYYEGMSQIPEIYRSTFASVPSMGIQAPGYSAPQMRYFSQLTYNNDSFKPWVDCKLFYSRLGFYF